MTRCTKSVLVAVLLVAVVLPAWAGNPFAADNAKIAQLEEQIKKLSPDSQQRLIDKLNQDLAKLKEKREQSLAKLAKPLVSQKEKLQKELEKAKAQGKSTDRLEQQIEEVDAKIKELQNQAYEAAKRPAGGDSGVQPNRAQRTRISLNVADRSLKEVLKMISQMSGVPIEQKGVPDAKITIQFDNLTVVEAMAMILDLDSLTNAGLSYKLTDEGTIKVSAGSSR